jgi:hypothetical protein
MPHVTSSSLPTTIQSMPHVPPKLSFTLTHNNAKLDDPFNLCKRLCIVLVELKSQGYGKVISETQESETLASSIIIIINNLVKVWICIFNFARNFFITLT